ncbi:MAG: gliding motility-associated C-terminal domain-containing protein [Bacteroidota bacterium]
MMHRIATHILLAFLLSHSHLLQSQNLVPNPHFDTFTTCPSNKGQINFATPWRRANGTTTDFAHSCGAGGFAGVPDNQWGSQEPAVGQGYAGIRTWLPFELYNEPYREYLTVSLLDTLEKGKAYFISFKVSPGESVKFVTDDVGLAFSDSTIRGGAILTLMPVLEQPTGIVIDNFVGWTEIAGEYIAGGWETDLVIGNFKSDSATTLRVRDNSENLEAGTYLYVDEVKVEACDNRANTELMVTESAILCPGDQTTLFLNPENIYTSFSWGNGEQDTDITVSQAGIYTLKANINGCTYQDSVQITIKDTPTFDLGADTSLCPGTSLRLSVQADSSNLVWNTADTTSSIVITEEGTYSLQAQTDDCVWTDSIRVTYESLPISPVVLDTIICKGSEIVVGPDVTDADYFWSTGSGGNTLSVNATGIYTVQVETQCFSYQEQYGITVENCDCVLFFPNVFSPNDDGINDVFTSLTSSGSDLLFTAVEDRWGRRVFQTEESNILWKGDYKGQNLPEGVYYWYAKFRCFQDNSLKEVYKRGQVLLLR